MYLSEPDKQKIIEICKRNDISFCGLFGSFARGEAGKDSDIDLLVRFSKLKGYDWLDAAVEIEDTLGRRVDFLTESGLKTSVRDYVMRDLQVLYGVKITTFFCKTFSTVSGRSMFTLTDSTLRVSRQTQKRSMRLSET